MNYGNQSTSLAPAKNGRESIIRVTNEVSGNSQQQGRKKVLKTDKLDELDELPASSSRCKKLAALLDFFTKEIHPDEFVKYVDDALAYQFDHLALNERHPTREDQFYRSNMLLLKEALKNCD